MPNVKTVHNIISFSVSLNNRYIITDVKPIVNIAYRL